MSRLFKFAEVDFGVKVGRKVFSVTPRVHIQNINGVYFVEIMLLGKCGIGIHDTRVETDAEYCVDARFLQAAFFFHS